MRKVIICEAITDEIKTKAEALGIGEIAVGIPQVFTGSVSIQLPCVVVESEVTPYKVLLVKGMNDTSTADIEAVDDYVEPEPEPEP